MGRRGEKGGRAAESTPTQTYLPFLHAINTVREVLKYKVDLDFFSIEWTHNGGIGVLLHLCGYTSSVTLTPRGIAIYMIDICLSFHGKHYPTSIFSHPDSHPSSIIHSEFFKAQH
jgi:hypothetical protein